MYTCVFRSVAVTCCNWASVTQHQCVEHSSLPGRLCQCVIHTSVSVQTAPENQPHVSVCAGNTSAIADYMFGSAYLAWPSPAAAAQNVSATVLSLKLSPKDQTEAFARSIRQTLSRAQPASTGVLIAAALGANETNAITEGFELVRGYEQIAVTARHMQCKEDRVDA